MRQRVCSVRDVQSSREDFFKRVPAMSSSDKLSPCLCSRCLIKFQENELTESYRSSWLLGTSLSQREWNTGLFRVFEKFIAFISTAKNRFRRRSVCFRSTLSFNEISAKPCVTAAVNGTETSVRGTFSHPFVHFRLPKDRLLLRGSIPCGWLPWKSILHIASLFTRGASAKRSLKFRNFPKENWKLYTSVGTPSSVVTLRFPSSFSNSFVYSERRVRSRRTVSRRRVNFPRSFRVVRKTYICPGFPRFHLRSVPTLPLWWREAEGNAIVEQR